VDHKDHQKGFTSVGIRTDVKESDPLYHGTKADLKIGDLIEAGRRSNYGKQEKANYVYLSATLDAAIWGAELATGEGQMRIYIVEPTGAIDDDPNLTDMKFPGNPTRSYRSRFPLRIIGEVQNWQGHNPKDLKQMRDNIEALAQSGIEAIN
jgi:rifampin ADP-ribosylating transferase